MILSEDASRHGHRLAQQCLGFCEALDIHEGVRIVNLLERFGRHEEASSLMRKIIPVARRIIGETKITTLRIRWLYALALSKDQAATLDDLRESVTTLEDVAPLWTRIFGEAHPETPNIKNALREARKALAARAA